MNRNRLSTCVFYSLAIVSLVILSLIPATASAGMFHWGDFAGTDVMYLDVTEDNLEPTSLFAPMPGLGGPMVIGNSLHLDPQGFASQSASSAHAIDSTLSTTIMAGPGGGIDNITVSELGDYSLGGLSGGQANAQVGAAFFWTVLEVDNMAVNLDTQTTNLILNTGSGPNGGRYDRPADDGVTTIWSGAAAIDLAGYLAGQQIDGSATKVMLRFDNTLQTAADDISTAFIKKNRLTSVSRRASPNQRLLCCWV